jgi:hypothetical protein
VEGRGFEPPVFLEGKEEDRDKEKEGDGEGRERGQR